MFKSRRFYILIIVILIGGVFEAFKGVSLQTAPEHKAGVTANELQNFDLKPFHMNKTAESDREQPKKFRIKKIKPTAKMNKKEFDFAKTHTFIEGKKKKTKKDKKTAKKKKDDKKKKKVEKKDQEPKEVKVVEEDNIETETDENLGNNNNNNEETAPGFAGPVANTTEENNNGVPQTYEEWFKILLSYPSHKKTVEFTSHYQSRRVSAAVFYEILTAMAEDNREEVNILGVRAAGSTPSYQSFDYLTTVIAETTIPRKARNLAKTQLEIYANFQYLNILKSLVINSEYEETQKAAAKLIAKSARDNLKKKEAGEGQVGTLGEEEPARDPAVSATTIKNYQLTKEMLNSVLQMGNLDSDVASAINEAINAIDESLS